MNEDRKHLAQIGRKICKARKEAGLNQVELAERVGTQASRISRLESGKVGVDYDVLGRIAQALGLSLDHLIVESVGKCNAHIEIQSDYADNPGMLDLAGDKKVIDALEITQVELDALHKMSAWLPRQAKKESLLQLLFILRAIA
jgi:transcriptional regulator with XRE-family HTH domain